MSEMMVRVENEIVAGVRLLERGARSLRSPGVKGQWFV